VLFNDLVIKYKIGIKIQNITELNPVYNNI